MAKNLHIDERVFVPVSKIKANVQSPSSFVEKRVLAVEGRSVRVDVGNAETELVASSLCHRNIGVLMLNIGDLETETTLLDPLGKSILQFCRLLVSDDFIHAYKVRSLQEIEVLWGRSHAAYSHVILIGHGSDASIKFANGDWIDTDAFMNVFDVAGVSAKTFISLCCETGYKAFGGAASSHNSCERFIGPFHSVHGAIASQFVQTFLVYHLLEGETATVAFKHARASVPGSTSFRLWKDRKLVAGPKS
ncbi:hypothetical protein LGT41_0010400 [Abyssibius alkaniclasticus]|uniref:hypothetical protein n=1 Tax=Abyssibius alkaniclasticus TaxID=2881234 RepID=UPI0023633790|nr:hypothetical protein [Abyssibius alkaniclasticus]UPH70216.1 hypothetical protein LGT41_0010400 [Abyssibius alkaniclasticus]